MKFKVVPLRRTRVPSSETRLSALLSSACKAALKVSGLDTEARIFERVVMKSIGASPEISNLRNLPVPKHRLEANWIREATTFLF